MGVSITKIGRGLTALAIAILALAPVTSQAAVPVANQSAVTSALAYITTQQQPDGQITGFSGVNPWALMAYAAAGQTNASLRAYLLAHPPAAGATATDWEKAILALVADGQNPYSAGGTDYVAGLKSLHTGGQLGSATAVNDDAFGVLALAAANVDPTNPVFVDALDFLLDHQLSGGGFNYSTTGTMPDVDDTAAAMMAIQAAQSAGSTDLRLPAAKASARAYVLGTQNPDGGFPYDPLTPPEWGGNASNVSTTAWVIIALSTIGEGSSIAATNAQNYIKLVQTATGSFPYQSGDGDSFNTAYAVLGLSGASFPVAVYTGDIPTPGQTTPAPTPSVTPTALVSPSPSPSPQTSPTITPTVTTSPTPGSVLGASTDGSGLSDLPGVGMLGSQAGLLLAAIFASLAAIGVQLMRRRRSHI